MPGIKTRLLHLPTKLWSEDGAPVLRQGRSKDGAGGWKMGQPGLKTRQVGRWGTTYTDMQNTQFVNMGKVPLKFLPYVQFYGLLLDVFLSQTFRKSERSW